MRYQTDTEGGNSGSPVIDDATGVAVGVHTHGGCTTGGGGNNSGTSTFLAAFWAEVDPTSCDIGGGGIPCTDISTFRARCRTGGMIQARVILTSTAHDGETVEFTIDGTDVFVVTIVGNRATLSATGYGAGTHTVALTDPAGCFSAITVNCTGEFAISDDDEFLKEDLPTPHKPAAFTLLGNYPNPFNPSTTIRYGLSEDTWVSLKVYNSLGQEVATLVNEFQRAGYRSAAWHGRNDAGEIVSSGIYVYRFQAGNVVRTERMMFLK